MKRKLSFKKRISQAKTSPVKEGNRCRWNFSMNEGIQENTIKRCDKVEKITRKGRVSRVVPVCP